MIAVLFAALTVPSVLELRRASDTVSYCVRLVDAVRNSLLSHFCAGEGTLSEGAAVANTSSS